MIRWKFLYFRWFLYINFIFLSYYTTFNRLCLTFEIRSKHFDKIIFLWMKRWNIICNLSKRHTRHTRSSIIYECFYIPFFRNYELTRITPIIVDKTVTWINDIELFSWGKYDSSRHPLYGYRKTEQSEATTRVGCSRNRKWWWFLNYLV